MFRHPKGHMLPIIVARSNSMQGENGLESVCIVQNARRQEE